MSGGSLSYCYGHINDAISIIRDHYYLRYCPLHGSDPDEYKFQLSLKLIDHLKKVSTVLHDIEWVMSGDYANEAEFCAIKEMLNDLI
jgi:hypothetical protein